MTGTFEISVNDACNVIFFRLSGYITEAIAKEFAMARSPALEKLSAKLGSHMTITDLRGCSVVSQELFRCSRTW